LVGISQKESTKGEAWQEHQNASPHAEVSLDKADAVIDALRLLHPSWDSPMTQTTSRPCRAHWSIGPEPGHESVASRPARPSPFLRRVGVHDLTFQAHSSFTRVAACRVARPPCAAFVTRRRPTRSPGRAACQPPDLRTSICVGLPPTGDLRRWGALRNSY